MTTATLPEIIPLWPDMPRQPDQESQIDRFGLVIRNVTQPSLTPFLPDPATATGAAVIVIPGGGFHMLPIENEGNLVGRWLADHGIAAFVLRYRLLPTDVHDDVFLMQLSDTARDPQAAMARMRPQMDAAVEDALQAIELVRARSAEWNLDPARIGLLGFSGGGVVTTAVITQPDSPSRVNFAGLIYTPIWENFVVPTPPAESLPLFLTLANDDPFIHDGDLPIYNAWHAAGYPVELHIYAKGGHAFGMKQQGIPTDHWIARFREWLQVQGFVS
ncbi:MAG: alpha/beta hydrolase [Chloroflexota bacterium]